jgi:membrane-associated phospholipid phosphatase
MSLKPLLELDATWSRQMRLDRQNTWLFKITAFLAHSGDSWFWLAGLGILWLVVSGEWHRNCALLAGGIVGLAAVVLAIKFTVRRQRPPGEWGAIYRNTDPHSFPSGHAARSAMLAVMAIGLGPAWFAWVMVIWAPLVSLARVGTGVHYLSDIVAGILLGILAGGFMLAIAPLLIQVFPFIF